MERKDIIKLLEVSDSHLAVACMESLSSDMSILKIYDRVLDNERQCTVLEKRLKSTTGKNLRGIEQTIEGLRKYKSPNIRLAKVSDNECTFSIFFSKDWGQLLGIFQNPNMTKSKNLELESKYDKYDFKDITKWKK